MRDMLNRIDDEEGEDTRSTIVNSMYDSIIKSLVLAQPHISHLIKSNCPEENENTLCYSILGFDFLVNSNF